MLSVSIIIPAWNESEHIADCLINATRQTMAAKEILVVDNRSTDDTVDIVRRFIAENPDAHVRLLEQDAEQGLIPTRNFGFDHATGDILGRVDSDSMLRPDWVEVVSGIFTEDKAAMGASGPVAYYDMPAAKFGSRADNAIRSKIYRADKGKTLLFGSNMAIRATAWDIVRHQVCRDKQDIMHEDIDLSLHLIGNGLKTVYSPRMVVGMSARRMDTSAKSFLAYMRRFHNTFNAHPEHTRAIKPEYFLTAMYPILHASYPAYQRYLKSHAIDPAERVWIGQQMKLASEDAIDSWTQYHDVLKPEGVEEPTDLGDDADGDTKESIAETDGTSVQKRARKSVESARKRVRQAEKRLAKAKAKERKVATKAAERIEVTSRKQEITAERRKAKRAVQLKKRVARKEHARLARARRDDRFARFGSKARSTFRRITR